MITILVNLGVVSKQFYLYMFDILMNNNGYHSTTKKSPALVDTIVGNSPWKEREQKWKNSGLPFLLVVPNRYDIVSLHIYLET